MVKKISSRPMNAIQSEIANRPAGFQPKTPISITGSIHKPTVVGRIDTDKFEVGKPTAQQATPQTDKNTLETGSSSSLFALQMSEASGVDKTQMTADQKAMNAFFDSDFTVADAETMAELWGGMSVGDAKSKMGEYISHGQSTVLSQHLRAANGVDKTKMTADQKAMNAFFDSDFTVADAEVMAGLWNNMSVGDAKAKMGEYISHGQSTVLNQHLEAADRTRRLEFLKAQDGIKK